MIAGDRFADLADSIDLTNRKPGLPPSRSRILPMMRSLFTKTALGLYRLSTLGMKKEFPFIRHAMYVRLREIGRGLPNKAGAVLSISHSTHLMDIMGLTAESLTEGNYPAVNILDLPYPDASFDFVLSDQVFEHIEGNPQRAIDECLRVLKPGGVMVHTTCFTMGYHGPGDYWRYTPEGLAHLCRNAAEVIDANGWGHPFVFLFTFVGFVWEPAPTAKWHPMNWAATVRRASYDYVVWVVARK